MHELSKHLFLQFFELLRPKIYGFICDKSDKKGFFKSGLDFNTTQLLGDLNPNPNPVIQKDLKIRLFLKKGFKSGFVNPPKYVFGSGFQLPKLSFC